MTDEPTPEGYDSWIEWVIDHWDTTECEPRHYELARAELAELRAAVPRARVEALEKALAACEKIKKQSSCIPTVCAVGAHKCADAISALLAAEGEGNDGN